MSTIVDYAHTFQWKMVNVHWIVSYSIKDSSSCLCLCNELWLQPACIQPTVSYGPLTPCSFTDNNSKPWLLWRPGWGWGSVGHQKFSGGRIVLTLPKWCHTKRSGTCMWSGCHLVQYLGICVRIRPTVHQYKLRTKFSVCLRKARGNLGVNDPTWHP